MLPMDCVSNMNRRVGFGGRWRVACSLVACLGHLTDDHAVFSRRIIVGRVTRCTSQRAATSPTKYTSERCVLVVANQQSMHGCPPRIHQRTSQSYIFAAHQVHALPAMSREIVPQEACPWIYKRKCQGGSRVGSNLAG